MQPSTVIGHPQNPAAAPRRPYLIARAAARSLLYGATLLPVALAALLAALTGQARSAAGWWRRLRTGLLGAPPVQARRDPGLVAVAGHALLSLLLGMAALVPLGFELLFVLRGVLYGLVDRGPYTTSWGGPTRAGAWFAHFLVGIPIAAVGFAVLIGIAATHQRLTAALDGQRRAPWLIPATLLLCLAGGLFVVAWSHQI